LRLLFSSADDFGDESFRVLHTQLLSFREALEISLKNVGRSDIKKEKDRDNYRTKVLVLTFF